MFFLLNYRILILIFFTFDVRYRPKNLQTGFIINGKSSVNLSVIQDSSQASPSPSSTTATSQISSCQTATPTRFTDHQEEPALIHETDCELETDLNNIVTFDDVVRIMVSYDIGVKGVPVEAMIA